MLCWNSSFSRDTVIAFSHAVKTPIFVNKTDDDTCELPRISWADVVGMYI
jgi:hypothetical protein